MLNTLLITSILALSLTSNAIVYTPNGTSVQVLERQEFSQATIAQANAAMDSAFNQAVRLSSATAHYNCHSYAWYSQNISTNMYWMNYPDAYYTDGSYYEVSSSQVQPRDRICYFNTAGENLHSGIVAYLTNESPNSVCGYSNIVGVQSKWGDFGLYQHKGDYCPYVSTHEGNAAYVKFYRINASHTHSFSYAYLDEMYHYEVCSCGTLIWQHDFVLNMIHPSSIYEPNYIPEYVCTDCGYSTLNPLI